MNFYIKVESNDTLYGSDVKFLREVRKLIDSVTEDLLELLASFVSFILFFRRFLCIMYLSSMLYL